MIYIVVDSSDYYYTEVMDAFRTMELAEAWIKSTYNDSWKYIILERTFHDFHSD